MFPSPFARLFGIKSASFANEQWSHGLQHLWHKRRNARFKGLRRIHTPSQPLTAHTAAHTAKQVVFWVGGGITTLRLFCVVRKPYAAGCQNGKFCRLWVSVEGTPEERRKPSGQRCAHACRCSEGVAAPLGCATLLLLIRSALKGSLQAVAETAENTYPPRTVRI